jgi:hypothetical protein
MTMEDYPKLRKALTDIAARRHRSFVHRQETQCEGFHHCLTCQALDNAERKADGRAQAAYASELLPAMFGGEWVYGDYGDPTWMWELLHGQLMPLFDHPHRFRRKGARGADTTGNSIVIAHPYKAAVDNGGAALSLQLTVLKREGVRVWLRDDLSSWVSGRDVSGDCWCGPRCSRERLSGGDVMTNEAVVRNAMDFSTVMDSVPPELLAWLESLSGDGKEDLILIPDREWIYIGQIREVVAGQKQVALRWGRIILACGDIDSCAHAPCQSKTPISHWTAGRFCDGCLGGGAGSMSQGLRVLV